MLVLMDATSTPLDPHGINIDTREITLGTLIGYINDGTVTLDFSAWRDDSMASRQVEATMLKLPFSEIWMTDEVLVGNEPVVDLYTFFNGDWVPDGLRFLPEYNGKRFVDLPSDVRLRIWETSVTVHTIGNNTPAEIVQALMGVYRTASTSRPSGRVQTCQVRSG